MGFEPTTSCIRGKRLTTRPRGPQGRERTTPMLILKHIESISPYARWYLAGDFVEKYFQGVLILDTVCFVLYREALVVLW